MMNRFRHILLPVLFAGTLVGLNEAITGNLGIPYRSAILGAFAITVMAVVRTRLNIPGTSLLIAAVAVLFKLNNAGFHTCTANVFLCGPTAMLLTGLAVEAGALLLYRGEHPGRPRLALTCILSAYLAFALFGLMNTFILGAWDTGHLASYILARGSMTAFASAGATLLAVYLSSQPVFIISPTRRTVSNLGFLAVIALWAAFSFLQV